jgi:nucleotide-binding universal stress UspA family protein
MMNIKRILCPIDLSPDSDKALRYAAAIARAYKAKLFVCYCAKEMVGVVPVYQPKAREEIKKVVQRAIGLEAVETMDLDWESIILEDNSPAEAITLEAATRGVDLIVMCSRRRPLRAALLGSTTESVYRTAPCPVLVLHPDQREWATAGESNTVALKRVLVAHDFSDYSELALRQALSLAQEYQAELHLLHVLDTPLLGEPEIAWIPSSTEGAYHKAARALQKAVPVEAYLWCEVKHAVRWGKPYREILNYAEEQEIDLICMGSQGTGFGLQTLFGSNVDRVIRQSPCPALVARPLRPTILQPSILVNHEPLMRMA